MNNMCNDLKLIVYFKVSPKHCTEHLGKISLKITGTTIELFLQSLCSFQCVKINVHVYTRYNLFHMYKSRRKPKFSSKLHHMSMDIGE